MKKLNFVYIFILGCILNFSNAQSLYSNLCGDQLDNSATVIKAFDGGVYIASYTINANSGLPEPIFSKFDEVTGNLIWSRAISNVTNSGNLTGKILDFEFVDPTKISNTTKSFILVGKTYPISDRGGLVNNASFIVVFNDLGNITSGKIWDQTGPESFNKIVFHPYFNGSKFNAFFIVSGKNTQTNPPFSSANDIFSVFNVNAVGTILSSKQFNSTGTNIVEYSNYGIIPRRNGNLALLGYFTQNSNKFGNITQIRSSDYSIVRSPSPGNFNNSLIFKSGIELVDSSLIIVGENINTSRGFISHFDKSLINSTETKIYNSNNLGGFDNVVNFSGNFFYVTSLFNGPGVNNGHPIVMEFQLLNNPTSTYTLSVVDVGKIIKTSTIFNNPLIYIRNGLNRIFYADTRIDPSGIGGNDLFWGLFDLSFSLGEPDLCTTVLSESLTNQLLQYDASFQFNVTNNTIVDAGTLSGINISPSCKFFCGPCPKLNVSIVNAPTNCFAGVLNLNTNFGGTGPYTYKWDLDCNSTTDGTSSSILYSYLNSSSKCVNVTVTDANGCTGTNTLQFNPTGALPSIQCISTSLNTLPGTCSNNYQGIISITNPCNLNLTISSQLSGATTGVFSGQGLIQFNKGTTTVLVTVDSPNNQSVFCQYLVTVIDIEAPQITCPPNIFISGNFCTGTLVTNIGIPIISDNCPMVSYSSSLHNGSIVPCGMTIVTDTAKDMSGNIATCQYNVQVDCKCSTIDSESIKCTADPTIFQVHFFLHNNVSPPAACTNVIFTSTSGTLLSGYNISWTTWGTAIVDGLFQVNTSLPNSIKINSSMTCSCGSNGPKTDCQASVSMVLPCCKVASLDSVKICSSTSEYLIEINFNIPVNNISSIQWYYSCAPCLPGCGILYANTFDPFVYLYPSFLECQSNSIYLYAVIHLNDGTCQSLTTNVSKIILCNSKCAIDNFEACYMGVPITNASLFIKIEDSSCVDKIEWYDPQGNLIPSFDNLQYIHLDPISFTGLATDCKQELVYTAKLYTKCGIMDCPGKIILYNNDAPLGTLTMDPNEGPGPFCPTDFTFRYSINCPDPETNPSWTWYGRPSGATVWTAIPGLGTMNPLVNTNIVSEDTYIAVGDTNGVCPQKFVSTFIDIIPNLKVTPFEAKANNDCNGGPIKLTVYYLPLDCPVTINWYKNGINIHSDVYTSSPAIYSYVPSCDTCGGGNYYCEVSSNCCNNVKKSPIVKINPTIFAQIDAPCFVCSPITSANLIKYTANVFNVPPPSTCTFLWEKKIGLNSWMPIASVPSMPNMCLTKYNKVSCTIKCGSCSLKIEKYVTICPPPTPISLNIPNITISTGTGSGSSGSFRQVANCGTQETVFIPKQLDSSIYFDGNLVVSEIGVSDLLWDVRDKNGKLLDEGYIEIAENEDHFQIGGLNKSNFRDNEPYVLNVKGYYDEDSIVCSSKFVLQSNKDTCCDKQKFISESGAAISIKMNQSTCNAELAFNYSKSCNIWIESIDWGGNIQKGPFANGALIVHNYVKNNISYLVKIKLIEYDDLGNLCNSTIINKIIDVHCQACCQDYKKFKSLVAQGFEVEVEDCNVSISAPQFGECYFFGSTPDFGDGSQVLQGVTPTIGTWTHQYQQSGIYTICSNVYGYTNQDTNQICWVREMCTDVKVTCVDSCVCDAFSNLVFRFDKSTGVKVSCSDSITLECPPVGCAWNLTGDLLCKGDCPQSSVEWQILNSKNNVIIASGISMSYPEFGLYIPNHIFEKGGRYILKLKGKCEKSNCECSIILKLPGCNSVCQCVADDLQADVNAGLQIVSVGANCTACFQPKQLQECDQVKWYLVKKPNIAFASSIGNQLICYNFGGSGTYQIKMSVIRLNDDGTICDDYEKVFSLTINCFKGPGGNDVLDQSCNKENLIQSDELNILQKNQSAEFLNSRAFVKQKLDNSVASNIEIKGNSGSYDHLFYTEPICFDSKEQSISLEMKWKTGAKKPFGTKLHLFVIESLEDLNQESLEKNNKAISIGTFEINSQSDEWIKIQNIFNPNSWNIKKCNFGLGKSAYLIIFVDNAFSDKNLFSVLNLRNICLSNRQFNSNDELNPLIQPNPSGHHFELMMSNDDRREVFLEVTNLLGDKVLESQLKNESIHYSFGDQLVPGIYFVKIKRHGKEKVIKIIKT